MKSHAAPTNEFFDLMADLAEDRLSSEQAARLEELLWTDEANRQHYIDFMLMVTGLYRTRSEGSNDGRGMMTKPRGVGTSVPSGIDSVLPIPDLTVPHSSLLTLPSSFVGGVLFSYVIAVLVVGVGLTIAGAWKLPDHADIARQTSLPTVDRSRVANPKTSFVGRITGMIDCQWADPTTAVPGPVAVPLGRKYAISSGLMEITYDTGARVILQGPVTYEVESRDSGYLSVGKLTARVDKKEERRTKNEELSGSNSPFLIPRSCFAVRTPTATVTDLGTEFGVDVSEAGETTSHVFRGSVKVQAFGANAEKEGGVIVLHENESACTQEAADSADPAIVLRRIKANPQTFLRRIASPCKAIDLLDIVAGGNGMGRNRERGIDPTTGMEETSFVVDGRPKNPGYHRTFWKTALIDGVFVPDGGSGPVVLDSIGNTFDGFPQTLGMSHGPIWARAADAKPDERANDPQQWIYTIGRGEQYMPNKRGLLGLHPNTGITFNLETLRKTHPHMRPAQFQAVAGVVNGKTPVDVWVFVDGTLRLKRAGLRQEDGATRIDVELGPTDRFLTLVSTCGDNIRYAWFVFGDPVLEMVSTEASQP